MFQRMDANRILEESRLSDDERKPRLMDMEDVPSWLRKDDKEIDRLTADPDEDKIFGRGSRQRKDLNYSEDYMEKEILAALEEDEDDDGSRDEPEKEVKKDGRGRKRKAKSYEEDSDDDTESLSVSSRSKRRTAGTI